MARSQGNGGPIPPCPTLLRPERSAIVLRRVGGQGIHSAGRENWLGLRVTRDQSHPVRIVMQEDTTKKFRRDSFVTGFELFGYVDTNTAIILTAARKIGLEQI